MVAPVSRVGDMYMGITHHGSPDCPHFVLGRFIVGAANVLGNGQPVVRIGDKGQNTSNPHQPIDTVLTGGVHQAGGKNMHRQGDKVDLGGGIGTTIVGSPNILSK